MSESEQIAAAPPQDSTPNPVMDEETRLRPAFVDKVLDAVEAGDDETARNLVQPAAKFIDLARYHGNARRHRMPAGFQEQIGAGTKPGR